MNAPNKLSRCQWACLIAAVAVLGWSLDVGHAAAAEAAPPAVAPPADDLLHPPAPPRPPAQADRDRIEALALYSAACVKEQREQYAAALVSYARAYRFDPQSAAILRGAVAMSARLGRPEVTWRYAVKLVQLDGADPELRRNVALQLSKMGQTKDALAVYEKIAPSPRATKLDVSDLLVWLDMGRLYCMAGRFDKGAERFATLIDAMDHPERFGLEKGKLPQLPGKWPEMWTLFGEAFLAANRYDQAADMFRRACPGESQKTLLEFHLATVDSKRGNAASALARLEKCFAAKLTGRDAVPYRVLEDCLTALGRQGELLGRLEALHAANPSDAPLAYYLAGAYAKAKKFDKAEPLLVAALKRSPALVGYRGLIDLYRQTKRYDALLRTLGEAFAKVGFLEVLAEKDRALAADAELVRQLRKTGESLLEKPGKDDYNACLALAELLAAAKDFDGAGVFFSRALKARPDEAKSVLPRWALALLSGNQHAQAVEVLQRAIDQKVRGDADPSLQFSLAMALERCGKLEESVQAGRRGLEMAKKARPAGAAAKPPAKSKPKPSDDEEDDDNPESPADPRAAEANSHLRFAWVLYRAKRYDEAARECAELLRKFDAEYRVPSLREVLQEVRMLLSNIAVGRNQLGPAEQWLEEVLDEFPDDPGALNDLGYLWADANKRLSTAHRMIRRAVDESPENAAYRDSLGWVLFRLKRFDEAIVELEKAAAKEPDPAVLDHLGDAYAAKNNTAKAADAFRRAEEAYRKNREPEKAAVVHKKIKP